MPSYIEEPSEECVVSQTYAYIHTQTIYSHIQAQLQDAFIEEASKEYVVGQSVRCCITTIDPAGGGRMTATLKPSVCI